MHDPMSLDCINIMRFITTFTNSLALAVPFLQLITADDLCVSGQFRLRIYSDTKECDGLSVKTKVNDQIRQTECGEAWGTEKDGIDGFPIIGEVPIDRENILEPIKFWFNQGPKDHALSKETEVSPDCDRHSVY